MLAAMKPGSVVVDLAAEAGGNCAATQPGKLIEHNGVTVIGLSPINPSSSSSFYPSAHIHSTGYTDLPSRLPTQSSTLYSNNITKLLLSMAPQEKHFGIDLSDEVVRGSIVTHKGSIVPTAPRPAPPPAPAKKPAEVAAPEVVALTPWQKTSREVAIVTGGMSLALILGKATGPLFMGNFFTFALASLIGYRTVWGVVPALHSPLMSVTNAISGEFGLADEEKIKLYENVVNPWDIC
jgi:NAD(P) transhydrogenase